VLDILKVKILQKSYQIPHRRSFANAGHTDPKLSTPRSGKNTFARLCRLQSGDEIWVMARKRFFCFVFLDPAGKKSDQPDHLGGIDLKSREGVGIRKHVFGLM
jgi:hypothetical protein